MATDNEFLQRIGYNAREYIRKYHKIEDSSRKITEFISSNEVIKPVDPTGNLCFLRKLEHSKLLDYVAQELVLTVPETSMDYITDMLTETIAEFER